jgi:hypothetical protein
MEKEVNQFMRRVVGAVEEVFREFYFKHTLEYLHLSDSYARVYEYYAWDLVLFSGGEAEYVSIDEVPRRVCDAVECMNEPNLRQVVHYFRIWFCDLPDYDFWVVIFGMSRDSRPDFPVILAYKDTTLIDDSFVPFVL